MFLKKKQRVRFVPLGGIVGVTKNMYLYEYYEGDELKDILIVDCGVGFPRDREYGVDLVIPDISYLRDKKKKIRAILLTHGHEDHISALPYLHKELGSPPLYATRLTAAFIKKKFEEHGLKVSVNEVEYRKDYVFSSFGARFIRMTHSIPDSAHILIKSPIGDFYHGDDFKLDISAPYNPPPDFYEVTKAGEEGILCLFSDCLGAEEEGLTLSEKVVGKTFEEEMRTTKGKFIMTTFSSNISRIRQCMDAAAKIKRKVVFLGRSMKENVKIASALGYLSPPHNFIVEENKVLRYPPSKICLIVAGSQGQLNSALVRLANDENKYIKVEKGDKVVFSSDPIPGNEAEIYDLIEKLTRKGAEVKYSDIKDLLHASGHGNQEDLKFMARFTNPRYFIPIGGTVRHQKQYQNLITNLGYPSSSVFTLDEGETVWFEKRKAYLGKKVRTHEVFVDAAGIGDVGNVVLSERKTLSTEGILVVNLVLGKNNKLLAKPHFVVKGFVFPRDEEKLFKEVNELVEKVFKQNRGMFLSDEKIKKRIKQTLENLFILKKGRKPILLVDIIKV